MTGQAGPAGTGAPQTALPGTSGAVSGPIVPGTQGVAGVSPPQTRSEILASSQRVVIETPRLRGSISLKGGYLDDLILTDLRETLEEGSPNIVLLSPLGSPEPYYADFGWAGPDSGCRQTRRTTLWTADGRAFRLNSR